MTEQIYVWVAYAAIEQQFHIAVPYHEGMTAQDAIEQSGIRQQTTLAETLHVGIFGVRIQNMKHKLVAGDRVEIYRPLTINPKDIRRKRAINNPVGRLSKGNRFKQLSS